MEIINNKNVLPSVLAAGGLVEGMLLGPTMSTVPIKRHGIVEPLRQIRGTVVIRGLLRLPNPLLRTIHLLYAFI